MGQAEEWSRFSGWEVTGFELRGMPENLPGPIDRQLALGGQRKLFGLSRPHFKAHILAEDLTRIRLYLSRNGYPLAKVVPGAEADEEKRQLKVWIEVDPGLGVRLGEIKLEGWPEKVSHPDTSNQGVLHEGQIFRDDDILLATEKLRSLLVDSGYANATLEPSQTRLFEDRVDLLFKVDPGHYSVIDSIVIQGCSDDLMGVAYRVLDLSPGVEYSERVLRDRAIDLRGTQLFAQVELLTEELSPGHLKLVVNLENARMRTWRAAVGTWTDNPVMLRTGWSHNNLFKKGVGFNVGGVLGTHEISLGTEVFWLGWLSPRSRTSAGFLIEFQDEKSYRSLEERIGFIQSFRPRLQDMLKLGVSVSRVDVETYTPDPDEAPDAQGLMLELWTDVKWGRSDNPIIPTKGHTIKLSATLSPPEGVSEAPYAQLQVDGTQYVSLGQDFILAGRLRVGVSQPLGEMDDLLNNRRFFAGGYNSMRGYRRRYLGPTDQAGEPRGGQFVGLAGVELRLPLFSSFDGAVFFDSGQVWREHSDIDWESVSGAVGLALDFRTPLGPIRLNYAVNVVNQLVNEPGQLWTFGIGYPW